MRCRTNPDPVMTATAGLIGDGADKDAISGTTVPSPAVGPQFSHRIATAWRQAVTWSRTSETAGCADAVDPDIEAGITARTAGLAKAVLADRQTSLGIRTMIGARQILPSRG